MTVNCQFEKRMKSDMGRELRRGVSGMGLWEKMEGGGREGEDLKDNKEPAFHQQTPAGQKLVRKQH